MTKEELQNKLDELQDKILSATTMEEVNAIKLEIEKYKALAQVEELKDEISEEEKVEQVYCIKTQFMKKETKGDLTKAQMQQANNHLLQTLKKETGIADLKFIVSNPFYVRGGMTYQQAVDIKSQIERTFPGNLTIEKSPDMVIHTDPYDELYCYKCGSVNMSMDETYSKKSAAFHSILGGLSDPHMYVGALAGDEFGKRASKKIIIKCNCCGNTYKIK